MKISLLLDREPFPEIFEATMTRFLSEVTGSPHRVKWHSSRLGVRGRLLDRDGLWYCNPAINSVFSSKASIKVFATPWREYLHGESWFSTAVHSVYLAVSSAPFLRGLMATHRVVFEPDIANATSTIILGGNSRLRLLDYARGTATTVLKEGFDIEQLKKEIGFRKMIRSKLVPPILGVLDGGRAFIEPLLIGTVADRLFSTSRAERVMKEALDGCSKIVEKSRRSISLDDWRRSVLESGARALARWSGGNEDVMKRGYGWMKSICDCLLAGTSEIPAEVSVAMTHGDLQAGNVLVGRDRIWLIDWERVDERITWYDPLTLALGSRRNDTNLVDRALRLVDTEPRDWLDLAAVRALGSHDGRLATTSRIAMYLVEELRFRMEESVMGPMRRPSDALAALVSELDAGFGELSRRFGEASADRAVL